jgi:hypothetical protein
LHLDDGVEVALGSVLARAGEGTVYEVVGFPQWVAKVFHGELRDLGVKRDKVAAMIASPPAGAVQADGFVVLTWPLRLLGGGGVVGYVMPRIDTADAVEIHTVSNPSDRLRPLPSAPQWTRHASWAHLVNTAANLCLAVETVHHVDAVIGDFQERNILVNDTTRVTLVDCDSMQFTDSGGRRFLCGVGRPEFTAPELAGVDLSVTARERPSDLFALAVHIHLLLMAGNHPFLRGSWTGGGEQPDALTLARGGQWAGGPGSALLTHPLAPSVGFLPESVQGLFVRAFTEGVRDPSARPSATEWRGALQSVAVTECPRGHQIPVEADPCPWCRIEDERQSRRSSVATAQRVQKVTGPAAGAVATPPRAAAAGGSGYSAPASGGSSGSGSSPGGAGRTVAIVAAVALAAIAIILTIVVVAGPDDTTTATTTTTGTTVSASSTPTWWGTSTYRAPSPVTTYAVPPPNAKECGPTASSGTFSRAASGSDLTSCPFAVNVREAVNASNLRFPAVVEVFSPVTRKSYAMNCRVEQVLTCRGGNEAVVYVY